MPHMYKHCCYLCETEVLKQYPPHRGEDVEIDDEFCQTVLLCRDCFNQLDQDRHHYDTAMYEKKAEENEDV